MSQSTEFDCLLGGKETLPQNISILKFSCARFKEIQQMKSLLTVKYGTKLIFQKLPKHMRRRIMSHNVKRLPRRLREIHINQMNKSGGQQQTKRPSRRFRRRPKNLLIEYEKRQTNIRWLKTHLWYAKRFHFIEKWNYKLPNASCDKSFRACYRAIAQHALLQDISYLHCVELIGNLHQLQAGFDQITNNKLGRKITSVYYRSGNYEGSTVLYQSNSQLTKPIGQILFQWKPMNNDMDDCILWLWIHTAYYQETLDTLRDCFHQAPIDKNAIKLNELKNSLNRLRLIGPLSNAILQDALKLKMNDTKWEKQASYWLSLKHLQSIAQLDAHLILSLMVDDPRFNLPQKRTKSLPDLGVFNDGFNGQDKLGDGAIWLADQRQKSIDQQLSNQQILEMRSKCLVPGSDLSDSNVAIPIMLVQQAGCRDKNLGFGSGWDIILPIEWTQSFWLALIMRGARIGGLREFDMMRFEMGLEPFLQPDTQAGKLEEISITEKSKTTYFRLPPNKRINYNKFAITNPFGWNWQLLVNEWTDNSDNFMVLRDKRLLLGLKNFIEGNQSDLPECDGNSLIPINLFMAKGAIKQFAVICLPAIDDKKLKPPIEPSKNDPNANKRKLMRKSHRVLLKKLRNRRVRARTKSQELTPVDKTILTEYTQKMHALWLPDATGIRYSCSRQVIGFVRNGGLRFNIAQMYGLGYITFEGFKLLKNLPNRNKLLVRNTNSLEYKWINFTINLNIF